MKKFILYSVAILTLVLGVGAAWFLAIQPRIGILKGFTTETLLPGWRYYVNEDIGIAVGYPLFDEHKVAVELIEGPGNQDRDEKYFVWFRPNYGMDVASSVLMIKIYSVSPERLIQKYENSYEGTEYEDHWQVALEDASIGGKLVKKLTTGFSDSKRTNTTYVAPHRGYTIEISAHEEFEEEILKSFVFTN